MTNTKERIDELVRNEFIKMSPLRKGKYSNRAILSDKCQSVVYSEWGIGNQNVWDMIESVVEKIIPEHMD